VIHWILKIRWMDFKPIHEQIFCLVDGLDGFYSGWIEWIWISWILLPPLLSTKEMAYTLTFTHTHHQNGSVECKRIHVVETWLTLLTQEELSLNIDIKHNSR
jgi:hypothetical protein